VSHLHNGFIARTPLLLAVALAAPLIVSSCARAPSPAADQPTRPSRPGSVDLRTEKRATLSYLRWTSYAYRIADSDVATATMTPKESVRVDSYIELNRESGRLIDQKLVGFTVRSQRSTKTRAVLAATERWRYRYVSLTSGLYEGPPLTASYETTYTLVRQRRGWIVDAVAAKPLTPIR